MTTLLHIVGCYLLVCQYKNGSHNSQQLFLINLAVSEGALNFLQFLTNRKLESISKFQLYIKTLRGYGFNTVYLLTMIYLTLDKLFDIVLNIRYPLYWSEDRTKILLKVTWVISISSAITVSIVYHFTRFKVLEALDLYVYPTLNLIFLICAGVTYVFIFHKYKQSRIPPVSSVTGQQRESTFKIFRKSRFYIPVLLITTFILFMAIPDFVQTFYVAMGNDHNHNFVLNTTLRILWALCYISDAIIYIWLKDSVRNLLKRKLGLTQINHRASRASVATITESSM